MHLCIPVEEDRGLASRVCAHFGSAPVFLIVDPDGGHCRAVPNPGADHRHGMCMPLAALAGERLDGVVVAGLGARALDRLMSAGLPVYASAHATVGETVRAFQSGGLRLMEPAAACAGHEHGGH
jgi:predicted Fe-Mo cluster-binding NifX family protein